MTIELLIDVLILGVCGYCLVWFFTAGEDGE